ncbi:hypothetical protein CMK19_04115 [Candidatus Poribacteria bacterium]|nr:hypothetical protein [Candidatus Poribacteria bacterium]
MLVMASQFEKSTLVFNRLVTTLPAIVSSTGTYEINKVNWWLVLSTFIAYRQDLSMKFAKCWDLSKES